MSHFRVPQIFSRTAAPTASPLVFLHASLAICQLPRATLRDSCRGLSATSTISAQCHNAISLFCSGLNYCIVYHFHGSDAMAKSMSNPFLWSILAISDIFTPLENQAGTVPIRPFPRPTASCKWPTSHAKTGNPLTLPGSDSAR